MRSDSEVESLLDQVFSDPEGVLVRGRSLLEANVLTHSARSVVLRAMSLAARMRSQLPESLQLSHQAVEAARAAGDAELEVRALMTLAGSQTIGGNPEAGLESLARAASKSQGLLHAEVEFQRGAVLARLGDSLAAEDTFRRILPAFEAAGDTESRAMTCNNLGMLRLYAGDSDEARRLLNEARELHSQAGNELLVASAIHNLGMVAAFEGKAVEAFRLFEQSEAMIADPALVAEHQVSRCELLFSVGLFGEATRLAEEIADSMHASGLGVDEAEARLIAAQASLAHGDTSRAISFAQTAAGMFRTQGREIWEASAQQVEVAARFQEGNADPQLLALARGAGEVLEAKRQMVAAANAKTTAARLAIELGDIEGAERDLASVAAVDRGPVELRLHSWAARAVLEELRGDRRGTLAAVRAGLDLLDRYQAAFGASDVRSGVEKHARELAEIGVRASISSGRPRRVFAWLERTRANPLRYRPVAPALAPEHRADLTTLRQKAGRLRGLTGIEAERLQSEIRRLQEKVRARSRESRGDGTQEVRLAPEAIGARLGTGVLIEYADVDEELWAVVLAGGRYRLHHVGKAETARRELESLRFALRRVARGRADTSLAREIAGRFESSVIPPLPHAGDPLIVVPTAEMYAAPWSIMPALSNSTVVVAPSASIWANRSSSARRGPIVVAAGPELEEAEPEVRDVAGLYPNVSPLLSDRGTVGEVAGAMDGASIAHIASHASFQVENPMFSSLRLADGDLYVYDIESLEDPPDLVVLSACDSGFTDTYPGEELLGLSSSLLAMGTSTVIASIGLVPDSKGTRQLMVALHRRLRDGASPSVALHGAQREVIDTPGGYVAAASFICIGGG